MRLVRITNLGVNLSCRKFSLKQRLISLLWFFFPVGLILSIESVSPLHNCKIHWTKYVNNLITMVIDDISKYHIDKKIDKKITAAQNNYIGLRNFWKCDPGLLLPEITAMIPYLCSIELQIASNCHKFSLCYIDQ